MNDEKLARVSLAQQQDFSFPVRLDGALGRRVRGGKSFEAGL